MDILENLKSEKISRLNPGEPLAVTPETTVREVFAFLKDQATGSVLIIKDGQLKGIFTERDALRLMATGGALDVPIESAMTKDPTTILDQGTVAEVIKRMSSGGYRRLPVVDSTGRTKGIVKVSGVVHYLVQHFPTAVYNLPPHPDPVMQEREGG